MDKQLSFLKMNLFISLLLSLFSVNVTYADWEMVKLPPVTLDISQIGTELSQDISLIKTGESVPMGEPLGSPTPPPAGTFAKEIEELARSLRYDPDLIYQFVHDHIAFEPRWGDTKGSYMTLMDRSGGSCDQASLMISLLKASGYSSASYVYGIIQLTYEQAANWFGVENNAHRIEEVLRTSRIPTSTPSYPIPFILKHFWVKVTIGGEDYVFDPSMKSHQIKPGIDFPSIIEDYNLLNYIDCISEGASEDTTGGADFIQNLNTANMQEKLTSYSVAFIDFIVQNHPDASLDDIGGGKDIIPISKAAVRQSSLPYQIIIESIWSDLTYFPEALRAWIKITLPGHTEAFGLPSSDVYGRRLTVSYNANRQPLLKLDGNVKVTGTAASYGGQLQILGFGYTIPNGTSRSASVSIKAEGTYNIINAWGDVGERIISSHRDKLRHFLDEDFGNNSESLLGESLAITGLTWLAQNSLYRKVVCNITQTYFVNYCTMGIVGHHTSPYVDIPISVVDGFSFNQSVDEFKSAFLVKGYLSSALEWGVIAQSQSGADAVSTIRLLDQANLNGDRVFEVTKTNYNAFLTTNNFPSYDGTTINGLRNSFTDLAIEENQVVWMPENGQLSIVDSAEAWKGYGILVYGELQDGYRASYRISGDYQGGYGAWENMIYDPSDISMYAPMSIYDNQSYSHYANPGSDEPIDLYTGTYYYDHTDMTVGTGTYPYSLDLKRSYNSINATKDGPMGKGWMHSFEITAQRSSNGFKAMGSDSPVDAAAAIVATYINFDLLKNRTLKNVVISAMTTKWMMDQMIDNVVTVSQPGSSMIFTKLPDGSYNPPPGKSGELTLTNDRYHLRDKKGNQIQFNEAGLIEQWSDTAGRTVDFAYDTMVHTNPEDRSKIFYSYVSNQWQEFPFDSDLVSHWTFENPANLGYDSKGQNHAAMPSDTSRRPSYTDQGRYNGGLYFDEDHNDYLEVSNPSNMNQESYTLTFWTELVPNHHGYWNYTWNGGYQGFIGKIQTFQNYNFSYKIAFYDDEGRGQFRTTDSPTYSCYNSAPAILNEGWCMWVLSVGNGIRSFYRDGWLVHQSTYTGSANLQNTYPFLIGSKFSYTSFYGTIVSSRPSALRQIDGLVAGC